MTNRSFFNSVFEDGLKLGSDFEIRPISHLFGVYSFSILYYGKFLSLTLQIRLTKRSIITNIHYTDVNVIKYSPYELREWCPAIFNPFSNYLHWQKFLRIALEIFVETNPKLLS